MHRFAQAILISLALLFSATLAHAQNTHVVVDNVSAGIGNKNYDRALLAYAKELLLAKVRGMRNVVLDGTISPLGLPPGSRGYRLIPSVGRADYLNKKMHVSISIVISSFPDGVIKGALNGSSEGRGSGSPAIKSALQGAVARATKDLNRFFW